MASSGSALVPALFLGLLVMAHQAALLVYLTLGQLVLLLRKGVVAALVLDTNRRAGQLEHLAEDIFQVTSVGARHRVHLVTVNHDDRRVGATVVGVAQV